MALPGITLSTSPTDFAPFQSMQIVRFDGKQWAKFGDLVSR